MIHRITFKPRYLWGKGILTLSALLFLSSPVLAGSAYLSADDPGSIINIRSSPSTNASILGSGKYGSGVKILGKQVSSDGYTWYRVRHHGSSTTGWVRGDLISNRKPALHRSGNNVYLGSPSGCVRFSRETGRPEEC